MAEKSKLGGFKIKLTTETSEKLRQDALQQIENNVVSETSNVVDNKNVNTSTDILKEKDAEHSVENDNLKCYITSPSKETCTSMDSEIVKESCSEKVVENKTETAESNKDDATDILVSEQSQNELTENSNEEIKETSDDTKMNASYSEYAQQIHYEGDIAVYTDPESKIEYIWSLESSEWILRNKNVENKPNDEENMNAPSSVTFENDTHTYTDSDGAVFIWDKDKNAWFPKVDDDFLAKYQMSYGFVDNTSQSETEKTLARSETSEKPTDTTEPKGTKRKVAEPPKWFEISEEENTNVYVSNLPLDVTEEEFVDVMQKCGLIMRDPTTQKMKIKLYTKPNSIQLKGDALCSYIKKESVELAEQIIDGYMLRNHRLQVQKAKFQMKGEYNPNLKPKKKRRKDKEKLKKMQEKLFDWRPEKFRGERSKHEKVVIIKNLFEPSLFDKEVHLILEYQQDMREECAKCGDVRRVVLYDRHPEGVAQVTMKEPEEADSVVKLINGRWFGKRQLTAEIWDGKTKYKMEETDADLNKRLGKWENFLESDEALKKAKEAKMETVEKDS